MSSLEFIRDLGIVVLVAALAGWGCRRLGLSSVVGYLMAGLIVGPYMPPVSLVTDFSRIHLLAQLGLVFLMFSVGLQLSLRRLRALGIGLLAATILGAVAVFTLARALALGLGLDAVQGLFFAGMLVSSSTAIVSKALLESGRLHSPSGQYAGAIAVLEDLVAVVVVAMLNSYLKFGDAAQVSLGSAVGEMGAFIVLLGVVGLLLIPWLLRRLDRTGNDELRTLLVVGLLCLLAVGAQGAGYSLALGAFLLGVVVADTPQRPVLERSFAGLRDLFTAVFFVAIGMMIDLHLLGAIWWQIILVTLFVVVVRISAYTFGLLAAGQSEKLALEAGLSLTAIGEFSFIIAQMGVVAGVLPAQYQPLSVAVALLTAVVSPWLTVRAVPLAESIVGRRPALIGRLVEEYRGWLGWVDTKRSGNALWRLSRKRLLQIGVGLAFASGLLLFAAPLEQTVRALLGMDNFLPNLSRLVFWGAVGLVTLGVLVAVWRNISALAMMVAEATTAELSNTAVLRPVVEHGLKAGAGVLLFAWLTAVSPFHPRNWWVLLGVVAAAAGVITLLGRRLVHWHSEMEVRLSDSITEGRGAALVAQTPSGWDLGVEEVVLPAACASAGASIRDLGLRRRFGCTVVGIDRQGIGLTNLGPDTVLYPLDRVLLLGSRGQVAAARVVLETPAESDQGSALGTLALSRIRVPADSPHIGRSLAESAPARSSGVQIAGIQRGDRRILTPGGEERLAAADDLLVIGTPEQLRGFRRWLTGAH